MEGVRVKKGRGGDGTGREWSKSGIDERREKRKAR